MAGATILNVSYHREKMQLMRVDFPAPAGPNTNMLAFRELGAEGLQFTMSAIIFSKREGGKR